MNSVIVSLAELTLNLVLSHTRTGTTLLQVAGSMAHNWQYNIPRTLANTHMPKNKVMYIRTWHKIEAHELLFRAKYGSTVWEHTLRRVLMPTYVCRQYFGECVGMQAEQMYCTHLYGAVGSGVVLQCIAIDHEPIAYTEAQKEPVVPPLERLCLGPDKEDST